MAKYFREDTPFALNQSETREEVEDEFTALLQEENRSTSIPNGVSAYFSRWQSFCGICLYVSVAGTTYAFGVYSELLRSRLGYSEDALDFVASIGNNGLYLSLLAGYSIQKFGFKTVVLTGGGFISIGFLYIWLAIIKVVPSNIGSICFFYFLSQAGVCCHISTAVTISVKLFPPESRGAAIGLSKGYFALSTAVLSDLAGGLFRSSPTSFILFIAIFIPVLGYTGSSIANVLPQSIISFNFERYMRMKTSLTPFIFHWISLFLCILLVGLLQYKYSLNGLEVKLLSLLVLLTVFSILLLPEIYGNRIIAQDDIELYELQVAEEARKNRNRNFNTFQELAASSVLVKKNNNTTNNGKALRFADILSNDDSIDSMQIQPQQGQVDNYVTLHSTHSGSEFLSILSPDDCYYGESKPLSESFYTWRLWCIFFIFMVTAGSGLMVIYNVDAIAEALGVSPSSYFVTLISLANGLGRVSSGLLSDEIIQHTSISKLQMLSATVFCMSILQFSLSMGSVASLSVCLLLVGYLFGCTTALVAVNVADIFGEKFIATNYGFIDTSPILGSYLLATLMVNVFYRENGVNSSGEASCLGQQCFRSPFLINGSLCLIASLLCYFAHWKTDRRSQYADL